MLHDRSDHREDTHKKTNAHENININATKKRMVAAKTIRTKTRPKDKPSTRLTEVSPEGTTFRTSRPKASSNHPLPIPPCPELDRLIGNSIPMCKLKDDIIRCAAQDHLDVLITGESGTGKEIVAQALHRFSRRSLLNFLPVNCAAIPENLLESELFGHVKGSFTGASSDHRGYFLDVGSGTLFLDEIGEIPLTAQPKLLRALQEGSPASYWPEKGTTSGVVHLPVLPCETTIVPPLKSTLCC